MKTQKYSFSLGVVLASILFLTLGATVYKTIVGTGSPLNNSIVVWDGINGNKVRYSGITINSTNDISGVNILNVGALVPSGPITQPYGGTGGTNPETAQIALMLRPGLDIQIQNYSLQMIATIPLSSGNLFYYDGSNITNLASTATGRTLLNSLNAAAALSTVGGVAKSGDTMGGNLFGPYVVYDPAMTNNANSNLYLTARAVAEKIESLVVGAFISSVDSVDLQVAAGNLSITNVVGTGRIVKESTLGGTNAALSALTDVIISNPYAGQLLQYNGTKWVNKSLLDIMHSEEVAYTSFLGVGTAPVPFTSSSINSGSSGSAATFMGRMGLWQVSSAAFNQWSGNALRLGGASSATALTNTYLFDCEFLLTETNAVEARVGYMDGSSTNASVDALQLSITNNTAYFHASAGSVKTLGTTPYTVETNIWYRLIITGTNDTAIANLYTNNISAWNDTITGTNVPSAAASQLLSAGSLVYCTGAVSTNKILMFINQMGLRYPNGY